MPHVNAICFRCKAEVHLDNTAAYGFCSKCGSRMKVSEAVERYETEHAEEIAAGREAAATAVMEDLLMQAEAYLGQGSFEAAKSTYLSMINREPTFWKAQWGLVLAETRNLEPCPIRAAEDYAYHIASELFEKAKIPEAEEWQKLYSAAFEASCFLSIDSIDPRVFVEVEVFRWNANNNAFHYPVSRNFDLQPLFDKVLWEPWNKLKLLLPEEKQETFTRRGESCCQKIWDYFDTGFANMEDLQNGNMTRLMGTWLLKVTAGAIQSDILAFSTNEASVIHLESCRLAFNYYDYYRFVKMDPSGNLMAGEHRHFPSSLGMGGDFTAHPQYEGIMPVMAAYDYILILPTALYTRIDPKKIEGYERACAYQQKCRTLPCFMRQGIRSAVQIRPIIENHDNADPTKKVSACYIATAVYGGTDAPQVTRLRRFRNETLHRTRLGRRFSAFYDRHSPKFAAKLQDKTIVNSLIRRVLNGIVWILK